MITVSEYKGATVGVFGLGKAGDAAVAALAAGKALVMAWDDSQNTRHDIAARYGSKICLERIAKWPWPEIKALILSPGVPLTHPVPHEVVRWARQYQCPVIGDIELLYRTCPKARYIGITGTNGKSTTTALIGHILARCGRPAEVGGNLGTAALALAMQDAKGAYVLELSSYQLDLVQSTRFNIAVWLNISPDHIDRHGSVEGYVAAKKHLFDRQQADDVAIIGVDDEWSKQVAKALKREKNQRVIEISVTSRLASGVYVREGILYDTLDDAPRKFDLNSIATLTGKHNWQNAAAAYAAARMQGIEPDAIVDAMKSFAGLRHRLQLVATVDGVRFINDSKATNANATSKALEPYACIYWIAGGKPKEGGIEALAEYFPRIAHAFLIGEAEDMFAATLEGKVPFTRCGDLKTAVAKAAELAATGRKKEAVVLLSPACASFDQFKNFEERGDVFCQLVEALAAGRNGGKRHAV